MQTKYYQYILSLTEPALLTQQGGNPNSAESNNFICGAAIRGLLAGKLGQNHPDFKELILSGNITFLNAYPVYAKERSLPIHQTWKRYKKNEEFENLALYSGERKNGQLDWPEKSMKNLGSNFVAFGEYLVNLKFISKLHHQRNRIKGRATKEIGAIFSYKSLAANQSFSGIFVINDKDPEVIMNKIVEALKEPLLFGRSRLAGYGGNAKIEWKGEIVNENGTNFPEIKKDQEFCLVLTSDYVGRNQVTGQIDPTTLLEEVNLVFKGKAQIKRYYWNFGLAGGYNSKWKLSLSQTSTLKAGSVVILTAIGDLSSDDLNKLVASGLGERRIDGFGRFIISSISAAPEYDEGLDKLIEEEDVKSISILANDIQLKLLMKALDYEIKNKASSVAGEFHEIPSRSLLGRLRVPLRSGKLDTLQEWLNNKRLRQPAWGKLDACRIGKRNLIEWLKEAMVDPSHVLDLAAIPQNNYLVTDKDATDMLQQPVIYEWIKLKFIDSVLAELSNLKKNQEMAGGRL